MLTALKFHVSKLTFSNPGHEAPDFRGDKALRGSDGDGKATIFEIDPFDVSGIGEEVKEALVAIDVPGISEVPDDVLGEKVVLAVLARINKESVRQVGDQWAGVRGGLWDGDNRA